MADAGKVMILPKGEYSASTQYEKYDMVTYNNVSYIAKNDVMGVEPTDTESWQKWIDGNFSIPKVDGETITIDENGVLHGKLTGAFEELKSDYEELSEMIATNNYSSSLVDDDGTNILADDNNVLFADWKGAIL